MEKFRKILRRILLIIARTFCQKKPQKNCFAFISGTSFITAHGIGSFVHYFCWKFDKAVKQKSG